MQSPGGAKTFRLQFALESGECLTCVVTADTMAQDAQNPDRSVLLKDGEVVATIDRPPSAWMAADHRGSAYPRWTMLN